MADEALNLARVLADDPWHGLTIELARGMTANRLTGEMKSAWVAKIYRNRQTASGRTGKPQYIIGLIGADEDGPSEVLKTVAIAVEQGDIPVDRA